MVNHTTRFRVRYAETDAQGVAHHSNFVVWLELARTNMLRDWGMSYSKVHELGLAVVVTHLELDYKLPAFFDQELTITTTVEQIKKVSFSLSYVIRRDDSVLATGKTEHAAINMANNRPTRIPQELLQLFSREETQVPIGAEQAMIS